MPSLARLALVALLLVCHACQSGAHAPEAAAPSDAPDYSCKRSAFGDPGATEYECPDALAAQLCLSQSVVRCWPTNRTRGSAAPGDPCRRGTWHPDAKGVFELGDNCAPNPRFVSEDTPKGSVCVKVSGAGPYCTHNCQAASDCADLHRPGFSADCRGGGCFLIPK